MQNNSLAIHPKPKLEIFNCDKHSRYIGDFTNMLNEAWGKFNPFFPMKESQLTRMLEFNPLFVIAFQDGEPAGILRTIARRYDEPQDESLDYIQKAAFICRQIPDFGLLTHGGEWGHFEIGSNTLIPIDATVTPKYRDANYPNSPVLPGMIDVGKLLLSENPEDMDEQLKYVSEEMLEQIHGIKCCVTYTPNKENIRRVHFRQKAIDPGVVLKDARKGYPLADVGYTCYKSWEFLAERTSQLGKAA